MDIHLSYQLKRSKRRRKTISLQIKEDGNIVIYAPYHTPKGEIEKFLDKNQSWIFKKLSEKERSTRKAEKAFLPGETFFYLGELYPLDIQEANHKGSPLKLSFGKFILDKDRIGEARNLFIKWYKKEAEENLTGRVNYYSHRLQLFPKGVKITSAKYRWGSCSRDNRLSFSWRMIMAPLSVIDYILIHELVHIKEKNHSQKFWSYLESILPEYREHKLWLKKNGHSLRL
jgi:hypothetical protein